MSSRMMTRPEREFYRRIGIRIKLARTERGWSQGQLALRLGVSQAALHYWERARNAPSLYRLRELEKVVGREVVL